MVGTMMGRAQMTLTMDHLYTKTTGKSSPPEEVKLFCADIVKASYGLENRVYDVTTTLRIMLSEQGSHTKHIKHRTHNRTRWACYTPTSHTPHARYRACASIRVACGSSA